MTIGTISYVRAALEDVPGVYGADLVEHGSGRIEAVVFGGDPDDIAEALYHSVPVGIELVGDDVGMAESTNWYESRMPMRFTHAAIFRPRPWWMLWWMNWWTTYRLPFAKKSMITYPRRLSPEEAKHSKAKKGTRKHEWGHVWRKWRKFGAPMWGPILFFFFPLPIFFSYRWFFERWEYLTDIVDGRRTVDSAAHALTYGYASPWPNSWMKKWFKARLEDIEAGRLVLP